jgi:hypothetical protein
LEERYVPFSEFGNPSPYRYWFNVFLRFLIDKKG